MAIVKLNDNPRLAKVIKVGMPNNRKRSAIVIVSDATSISSYFSGGSRDEWSAVRNGRQVTLPAHAGAPGFDRPANYGGVEVVLDDGLHLVCGGTFCGKPATPKVYANKQTMEKLLDEEI